MRSSLRRRIVGAFAAAATAATLIIAAPGIASAQQPLSDASSQATDGARDAAWNARNGIHQGVNGLPPEAADAIRGGVDNAVNGVFPGLIDERTAPAPAPVAAPAPAPVPSFDYGSCPKDAKACIDLNGRRTWLQRDGQVYYGDVFHGPGRIGYETPRGTFYVNRKVRHEISREFNNAPMPYAVYFTYNGIAFHQGDPNILSHGCIRLNERDAAKFFADLNIGDKVYVY
ncbi:L,D-transpeptidase [Corynebacterium atrinae]|uniref:L,D-transpeptidase n=1 Tax=Corynebacterium atrinae TaxID=1336740 RepID=UPI0025B429E8|nr:L,D-transpeptidase [Corynebacterium atrinae]